MPRFDKTARIWNADGSDSPIVLKGHESDVSSVAFNPDGRMQIRYFQAFRSPSAWLSGTSRRLRNDFFYFCDGRYVLAESVEFEREAA